jgi:hypothetical protein
LRRQFTGATLAVLVLSACTGHDSSRLPKSSDAAAAVPTLDPAKVPADLRDLIPFAQRWGIGDDVVRAERFQQATETERSELRAAFGPRQARITAWLDSFGQGVMPDEAAAFMYAQLAIEEAP